MPQTTDTVLAAAMNKIWAIINVGVVSTSCLGVEQMLCVCDGWASSLSNAQCASRPYGREGHAEKKTTGSLRTALLFHFLSQNFHSSLHSSRAELGTTDHFIKSSPLSLSLSPSPFLSFLAVSFSPSSFFLSFCPSLAFSVFHMVFLVSSLSLFMPVSHSLSFLTSFSFSDRCLSLHTDLLLLISSSLSLSHSHSLILFACPSCSLSL